ncbi:MAG: hypothetical protein ACLTXH_01475 [Enterobacter hormaechei]
MKISHVFLRRFRIRGRRRSALYFPTTGFRSGPIFNFVARQLQTCAMRKSLRDAVLSFDLSPALPRAAPGSSNGS